MMNDLLRKFEREATRVSEPDDPDYRYERFDIEKFAELIVRECAYIASVNQYLTTDVEPYVLKHFGVER